MTTETRTIDRLVFIYAAKSGKAAAFFDSAKKLLNIEGCALCALTHGLAGERREWRSCREELGVPVDAYHLDEIPPILRQRTDCKPPCIYAQAGAEVELLLDAEAIERLQGSITDFRARLGIRAAMKGWELPADDSPAAA